MIKIMEEMPHKNYLRIAGVCILHEKLIKFSIKHCKALCRFILNFGLIVPFKSRVSINFEMKIDFLVSLGFDSMLLHSRNITNEKNRSFSLAKT
jgi:hypothetical protein